MAIPDFQSLMRPLLLATANGTEHAIPDLKDALAIEFGLTSEERAEMLPSGRALKFDNRVDWSVFHLAKAGLLARTGRARVRSTARGQEALRLSPERIDIGFLARYPEYRAMRERSQPAGEDAAVKVSSGSLPTETPEEAILTLYGLTRAALAEQLKERIAASSPAFFERLVVDLLVAMGYGGSRQGAARAVGGSGDGGIDGVINEDRLGLDVVYLQAKRWANPVSRPVVQAFAGSLEGHRARKGVMITTSTFTAEAVDYVSRIEKRIVLIDGDELADLMIDHGVGVANVQTYTIKRVDTDYFEEGLV